MRVVIFLILLYMQYCSGQDILNAQLMNEMREIRRTVKILETNLEQQRILTETHEKRIAVLQDVVASHEIELDTVKRELEVLKKRQKEDMERERIAVDAKSTNYSEETRKARKERETDINVLRKGRIIPNQPSDNGMVAFYAYMTSSMTNVGAHHIIIFDQAVTNIGNAYHPSTGVFIAPTTGLYAFSWSIRVRPGEEHVTELAINGNAVGKTYNYASNGQDHYNGATIIVNVNKGDDVFLRTFTSNNQGGIYSDSYGLSSFTGWKL